MNMLLNLGKLSLIRSRSLWTLLSMLGIILGLVGVPTYFQSIDAPDTLDASWVTYTHTALLDHLRFGIDYIWTYGPLGFLDFPLAYSRRLFVFAFIGQVILILFTVFCLIKVLRRNCTPSAAVLIMVILMLPYNIINIEYKAAFVGLILLFDEYFDQPPSIRLVASGLFWALAALVKVSLLPVSIIVPCFYVLSTWKKYRMKSLILPITITLGWLTGFIICGQSVLSAIITPFRQVELILGYSSMSVDGSGWYILALVCTWILTLMLILGIAPKSNYWRVLMIGLLLFQSFKEGFVRQDGHVFTYFYVAMWMSVLLWSLPRQFKRPNLTLAAFLALCFAILTSNLPVATSGIQNKLNNIMEAFTFLSKDSYKTSVLERQQREILASRDGLSDVVSLITQGHNSSVFAWPWDINALIAMPVKIAQPPVPQEYSTYTAKLDDLDKEYFSRPTSPSIGLISLQSIDGRLPLQTAPATWQQILESYEPLSTKGEILVIKKRERPVSPAIPFGTPQKVNLSDKVKIPQKDGSLVLAKIEIKKSLYGQLKSFLFRESPLYMTQLLENGTVLSYRLVAQTLNQGIIVSQSPRSVSDLQAMWTGLSVNRVVSISIWSPDSSEWQHNFTVQFETLQLH